MEKDTTEIYAEREREFAGLMGSFSRNCPLTGKETDFVVAWARACMQKEPLDLEKNTPAVKGKVLEAFHRTSGEFPSLSAPKKPAPVPPPAPRAQVAAPGFDEVRNLFTTVVSELGLDGSEFEKTARRAAQRVAEAARSPLGQSALSFLKKTLG